MMRTRVFCDLRNQMDRLGVSYSELEEATTVPTLNYMLDDGGALPCLSDALRIFEFLQTKGTILFEEIWSLDRS